MSFDLNEEKLKLVNVVCGSLFAEPRFNQSSDPTAQWIATLVERVAARDPEFILKVALYIRDDLNIRSTANFLLALAANIPECGPHFRKYFHKSVRLPSDWLDVAALYQLLPNRTLKGNALPTALRKAMKAKFAQFDAYQLAKYNKQNSLKKKRKKALQSAASMRSRGVDVKVPPKQLTIKQLIRQLHISQPAPHVMAILGKKYPMDLISFRDSGLNGNFDETRAGTRMKLATPETWETMISARGNKAAVWEELIDNRKLPFMAMLRNLRNLLITGISKRHHNWVKSRLRDERTVANSRQFPFSFFTAYEALNIDLEQLQQAARGEQPATRGGGASRGGRGGGARRPRKTIIPVNMPTEKLIREYKEALDTAVKYATVHNVKPIRGRTLVILDDSDEMQNGTLGRAVGRAKTLTEVGLLLGLMCKYMCEDCEFLLVNSTSRSVDLIDGTILENMDRVRSTCAPVGSAFKFPFKKLESHIKNDQKLDNIIVLSNRTIAPGHEEMSTSDFPGGISAMLKKVRQLLNPDLLYVSVNLVGAKKVMSDSSDSGLRHPNDVLVSGFSEAILKYVAERGDGDQIEYIQHIDETKNLDALTDKLQNRMNRFKLTFDSPVVWSFMDETQSCKWEGCTFKTKKEKIAQHMAQCGYRIISCPEKDCPESFPQNQEEMHKARCFYRKMSQGNVKKWREVRVFVSSTFMDMHGERDVLTRFVFPEIKAYCAAKRINFFYVDLRWGITEEDFKTGSLVDVCLNEVERCKPFFLGLLGDRYGYIPPELPSQDPRYGWLAEYEGRSITELEIISGALSYDSRDMGASIYIRENSFNCQVPADYRSAFECSPEHRPLLEDLKDRVRQNTKSFSYTAGWGGVVDGKPVAKNLQRFRELVTRQLRADIDRVFPDEGEDRDELDVEQDFHEQYVEEHSRRFVGRSALLKQMFDFADEKEAGPPMLIHGEPGLGKSAVAARFCRTFAEERPGAFLLPHFVSASPNASDIRFTLWRLCSALKREYDIKAPVPESFQELKQAFPRFLEQASFGRPCVIVIDSLQRFKSDSNNALALQWLPSSPHVRVILTTYINSQPDNVLRYREPAPLFAAVERLEEDERKELVRLILSEYRKKLEESPTNNQMRNLIRKTDSSKPLWLVKACEELCLFGVYEKLSDEIRRLPATSSALLAYIIQRFENDYGKDLVSNCLSLLACSRSGLTEEELLTLLSSDSQMPLPQARWAELSRGLESFLTLVGHGEHAVLNFSHDNILAAVRKRYLRVGDRLTQTHNVLASFFLSQKNTRRAVSELPYHLLQAGRKEELENLLCDLEFLRNKVNMGMTHELADDLQTAVQATAPTQNTFSSFFDDEEEEKITPLEDCYRFIMANSHTLARQPNLLLQQAANQPDFSVVSKAAQELWENGTNSQPWLKWRNKLQKHDPCKLTVAGQAEAMMAAAFSPDGKSMVCASRDRSLKIYDTASGGEKANLIGHTNWVVDCTYSHDGSLIASASWDETVRIWDSFSGAEIKCLTGHAKRVSACCFSSDDVWVLSGSWDCTMQMSPAREGASQRVKYFRGHNKPISAVALSRDATKAASASWDCTVRLWNTENTSCLRVLQGHTLSVRSVTFSPDASEIVSTSSDCTIRRWDVETGEEFAVLNGHARPVNSCAFSADGRRLISSSDDQTIKVWDAQGGSQARKMRLQEDTRGLSVDMSLEGKLVATGNSDCSVSIWNTLSGAELCRLEKHTRSVSSVVFSPDTSLVASGAEDHLVCLWNVQEQELLREIKLDYGVHHIVFSPVAFHMLVACDDGSLIEYDLEDLHVLRTYEGHNSAVLCCDYSPDGQSIVSSSKDGTLREWNSRTGACIRVLRGHMDWVTGCAYSPDSQSILSVSWDFNGIIWQQGKQLHTLRGHTGAIAGCCWSPDSQSVATCSMDNTIKLWNVRRGQVSTTIEGHTRGINSCAWRNKSIVSCGEDGTVRVWDSEAGVEMATFQGHSDTVKGIAFSHDKTHIVSASEDCTVKVWDAADTEEDISTAHKDAVTDCAFSPSGEYFISASRDCTAKLYDVATCQLIDEITDYKESPMTSCTFASDNTIYCAYEDGKVVEWSMDTKHVVRKFSLSHKKPVSSLRALGMNLISTSWDGSVGVWSDKGASQRTINQHTDWVNHCAVHSSSPTKVLTASHDHTVRISSISGSQSSILGLHDNWALSAEWSPCGTKAVSTSYDATVKLWDVQHEQCLDSISDVHSKRVNHAVFSEDSRYVYSTSHDRTVAVFDCRCHETVTTFQLKGYGTCLSRNGQSVHCGDSLGNIYLMQFMS